MFKKLSANTLLACSLSSLSIIFYSCDSSVSNSLVSDGEAQGNSITSAASGKGIDPDFQATVDRFVVEANKRGISLNLDGLDIQYSFTDGAFGVCSSTVGNSKDIVIDRSLSESSDDLLNEIILHELGHCILGREHSNNRNSIMHATRIIGDPWRTEVLDELFRF